MPLPIYEIENAFRTQLRTQGQCVVTAPTGSGKSTQIPKWALEELPGDQKVIVLQPRRLAARMLAERVAWEMGGKPGETVGYLTRFEHALSNSTRILFVTEGILTRMLLNPAELRDCGAILFDEFHERTLNADLGLAMAAALRKSSRPELRLAVMSATLDAQRVSAYLDGCPVLSSEGRQFPVELSYTPRTARQDLYQNAAAALLELLSAGQPGDVLIFMPGAAEIHHCAEAIARTHFGEVLSVLPLYGEMPPEAQHAVMAPSERRKIIIATNIAETSLTIPGVRMVIDSGLVKLSRYEPMRGVDILETVPISNDSALQRAGRAGREAPGLCRRLWSQLEQDHRTPHTPPEIQRMDLADALLSVHCYGYADDRAFPWFEAPPEKGAAAARELLRDLGLLQPDGKVTDLGRQIRAFPTHPRLALLLWTGARHGIWEDACGCAAILSERPLITSRGTTRGQLTDYRSALRHQKRPESDFLAQLALVRQASDAHFDPIFCESLGIQAGAARDIARDWKALAATPHAPAVPPPANPPDDSATLARALLRCFPDRLARRLDHGTLACELQGRRRATLSPQSLVRDEPLFIAAELREISGGRTPGTALELSLASGIKDDWLWEFFPDELKETDEITWDGVKQQVLRRRTLTCLGLVLEESVRNDPDPEQAAALLNAQLSGSNAMPLLGWDDSCTAWIDRVRFLGARFPKLGLPSYTDEECAKARLALCQGETRYAAVRNKPALPYLQSLLAPAQLAQVERLAPASLPLPRGKRMRLEYHPGLPPKGRAKIQELYDVTGPITIADGQIPVLLDILAPNFRTVQITDDLPHFWQENYPAIKSQLARRYPKHEWR